MAAPSVAYSAGSNSTASIISTASPAPGAVFTAGQVQVLVLFVSNGSATVSPPAGGEGWITLCDQLTPSGNRRIFAAYRQITTSGMPTGDFTLSLGVGSTRENLLVAGADAVYPLAAFAITNPADASGAAIDAPSVSSGSPDALLLTMHGTQISNTTQTLGVPAGMTLERFIQAPGTTRPRLQTCVETRPTAGASGPRGSTPSPATASTETWALSMMWQSTVPTATPVTVDGVTAGASASGTPGTVAIRATVAGSAAAVTGSAAAGAVTAAAAVAGFAASAAAAAAAGTASARGSVIGVTATTTAAATPGAVTARAALAGLTGAVAVQAPAGALTARAIVYGVTAASSASAPVGAVAGRSTVAGVPAAAQASADPGTRGITADVAGTTASATAEAGAGRVIVTAYIVTFSATNIPPSIAGGPPSSPVLSASIEPSPWSAHAE